MAFIIYKAFWVAGRLLSKGGIFAKISFNQMNFMNGFASIPIHSLLYLRVHQMRSVLFFDLTLTKHRLDLSLDQ